MLTLLRRLRASLISRGNMRKYMFYAISEILFIVLGILIALQINTWHIKTVEKNKEREFLSNLVSDISNDIKYLHNTTSALQTQLLSGRQLIDFLYGDISIPTKLEKLNSFLSYTAKSAFILNTSTYVDLESSASLRLIQNQVLKKAIIAYYKNYEVARGDFSEDRQYDREMYTSLDVKAGLIKYDAGAMTIYSDSEFLDYSQMSFLDNPKNEKFILTESAISARAFVIQKHIRRCELVVGQAESLLGIINNELNKG